MKKSLLFLLALFPQLGAEQNYQIHQREEFPEDIEALLSSYKHPKAKEVGDHMPFVPTRGKVDVMDMHKVNKETGELVDLAGNIIGYDLNGDGNEDYQFITRSCDPYIYAVLDVDRERAYVDHDRDGYVDEIIKRVNLIEIGTKLPMVPIKCEQEKQLGFSELDEK